jgi:hypothetical protein
MKDLSPYLYPLIFAALVLLNYLMQRIAKWQKRQQSAEKEESKLPQDEVEQRLDELKRRREQLQRPREQPALRIERPAERIERVRAVQEEPLEVRQARARASGPAVPAPPVTRAQRASGVRALLGDRRSLRQAVILMTVLGPCRAQQSPDGRQGTLHDE